MTITARPTRPDHSTDPDGEFPLGAPEYFFYLLFQAARQRDLVFSRKLEPTGLSLPQWRTLAIIRRVEGCTMTSLALYSTVERTTLTRAVDQLVDRGLVARWVPDRDRRQVNLALTELGETTYSQAVSVMLGLNEEVLDEVEPDALRDATRVLQTAIAGLIKDPRLAGDILTFGRPG